MAVGLGGCTNGIPGSSGTPGSNDEDFVSDNPSGDIGILPSGSDGDGTGIGSISLSSNDDEADRAITEADIIQVKDGKLYALSQYAGLTVVDISVKGHPSVLGRHALKGIPFEMYLRDGTVYALFSGWIQDISGPGTKTNHWVYSSHIEALDVSNPAAIHTLGAFDLPGDINDSRLVGDVLYAVSQENGSCWGCTGAQSTITSIAVGNPVSIHKIDKLAFAATNWYFHGWFRTISIAPERMYVAGVEPNSSTEERSTIQVVDIKDPTGHLTLGASVEAKGQITSRWQMDEYKGVLRVVGQTDMWSPKSMPAVQTFTVASSQSVTPIGSVDLTLPKPELLRSVRFDGARAFAITNEPTDPLLTLDLSDPAHPQQVGAIAKPGSIYRLEPRGDRLLALGYDKSKPEGLLTVSLFDVADLTSPTLLNRVAFGRTLRSGPVADQDGLRKAFTILPDQGLILMPYVGSRSDNNQCGTVEGGIQLIDYSDASLTKRGVAPSHGQAKRVFLHDDQLFAMSDDDVRSFDITDRSAPAQTASLTLAPEIDDVIVASDKVVRVSSDELSGGVKLEVVSASAPGSAVPIGSLDLASITDHQYIPGDGCRPVGLRGTLFAHGTDVYIVWPIWEQNREQSAITVVSIADPAHPVITGQITVDARHYGVDVNSGGSSRTTIAPGANAVQAGSTLIFRRATPSSSPGPFKEWLEIIDLADNAHPAHAATVELPEGIGHTPLRIDGTTVLTSHWVSASADDSKVRFYLDRIDVASPSAPVILAPVNVPGSLVTFGASSGRLLTVDYKRLPPEKITAGECWKKYGNVGQFKPVNPKVQSPDQLGSCEVVERSWKLLDVSGSHASLLDTRALANDKVEISDVLVGDDRVFTFTSQMTSNAVDVAKVEILGGLADRRLAGTVISAHSLDGTSPVAVAGKRLLLGSYFLPAFSAIDATNLASVSVEKKVEIGGTQFFNGYVLYSVVVNGDEALCSLGHHGLEVVDIAH